MLLALVVGSTALPFGEIHYQKYTYLELISSSKKRHLFKILNYASMGRGDVLSKHSLHRLQYSGNQHNDLQRRSAQPELECKMLEIIVFVSASVVRA